MLKSLTTAAYLIAISTKAGATGLCAALPLADPGALAATFAGQVGFQDCAMSPEGGAHTACRWEFDLGNAPSRQAFAGLADRLDACPGLLAAERDQGVNHPDFYDAWHYRFDTSEITLSIKDKAALGATYVVLRLRPGR